MKKNIIVIPIEIKVREFLPKLFLSCNLVKNTKFEVFFGGQRFLTKKLIPKNCIYFDKFTYSESRNSAPYHQKNRVIMQDEEGPISFFHKKILKKRYDLNQKKYLDFFLFSGKRDLELVKYLKISKNKKKIFGIAKLDLLKKKNLKFFDKEVNEIKNKYKNFLFVTGHSSLGKTKNQSKFMFGNDKTESLIKNYDNVNKNYLSLIMLCKKIAILNPDLTVIFRRHPREINSNVEKILGKKPPNLKLIFKYSVTPWMIACKYYLHSGCQTSLEAIALKKKMITFIPHNIYSIKNYNLIKPFFTNEKKCIEFIKKSKDKDKFYRINKKVEEIALNLNDKITYSQKFEEFIKKNYNHPLNSSLEKKDIINQNIFKKLIFYFLSKIKSFLILNDIYLSMIPRKYYISKEMKEQKFKSIKLNEMTKFINLFNRINRSNIKVKNFSESTFLIFK